MVGGVLALLPLLAGVAVAVPYGAAAYGACTYDTCGITMTTSSGVSLNTTASGADVYTINKDVITITTGAGTGYTLQLESGAAATTLAGSSQNISAVTASIASPTTLSSNTWGYRLDNIGGFGVGPTSAVTNASSSSLTFAGLSPNGSPATLKVTATAASAETTDVWYGVRVSPSLESGAYSRTVLYTAVTNS